RLGVLPVNMGNAAGIAHDSGGRLALFVKGKDCGQCDARLAAVLADNRPVDIYLVDSKGDDDVLRSWAKAHHIPADKVRARQITLNHDGGRWIKFGNGLMPVVLQQGKDGWTIAAF
ncbi:TIGR03759 family integrating conjugative element protein, partial [Escherichia coli]